VLVSPPTASDPRHATYRCHRCRLTTPQCPQPRHLYRLRRRMRIHVDKTASSCFCALHSIRRTVSKHVILSLVVAMVLARLDYGTSTLAGLTVFQICYLASFSLCSTLLHDWCACSGRIRTTTLRHCSVIYTGCYFQSASRFVWLCLPIGANMVRHRLICQLIFTASQMLTPVGDFDPHRRQCCSFHARDFRQLVNDFFRCRCTRSEQSTTQCHFSALSFYFQKETHNRTFFSPLFALTVYKPLINVYFVFKRLCVPPYRACIINVYFVFKRLCVPPYRACIVILQLNFAYVTLICSLTN